jgi:hypothetical protein
MTYSDNKSFLLKTPSETSWHFFLSDEHTIIYRSFKEQAFGPPSTLNLQHIKDVLNPGEICITNAGAVISSHCGPGTVGILYIEK